MKCKRIHLVRIGCVVGNMFGGEVAANRLGVQADRDVDGGQVEAETSSAIQTTLDHVPRKLPCARTLLSSWPSARRTALASGGRAQWAPAAGGGGRARRRRLQQFPPTGKGFPENRSN